MKKKKWFTVEIKIAFYRTKKIDAHARVADGMKTDVFECICVCVYTPRARIVRREYRVICARAEKTAAERNNIIVGISYNNNRDGQPKNSFKNFQARGLYQRIMYISM